MVYEDFFIFFYPDPSINIYIYIVFMLTNSRDRLAGKIESHGRYGIIFLWSMIRGNRRPPKRRKTLERFITRRRDFSFQRSCSNRSCLFCWSDFSFFFFLTNYLSLVRKIRHSLSYILKCVLTFTSKNVRLQGGRYNNSRVREYIHVYLHAIVDF